MFRAPLCPSSGAGDYKHIHSMWYLTLVTAVPHTVNICIVSSSWWWA